MLPGKCELCDVSNAVQQGFAAVGDDQLARSGTTRVIMLQQCEARRRRRYGYDRLGEPREEDEDGGCCVDPFDRHATQVCIGHEPTNFPVNV